MAFLHAHIVVTIRSKRTQLMPMEPLDIGAHQCTAHHLTHSAARKSGGRLIAVMPLPDNVAPPPEDNDDLQEEADSLQKESNKWQDLGHSQLQ